MRRSVNNKEMKPVKKFVHAPSMSSRMMGAESATDFEIMSLIQDMKQISGQEQKKTPTPLSEKPNSKKKGINNKSEVQISLNNRLDHNLDGDGDVRSEIKMVAWEDVQDVGDTVLWNHTVKYTPEGEKILNYFSEMADRNHDNVSLLQDPRNREAAMQLVLEAMRCRAMQRLAKQFHEIVGEHLGTHWPRHFEKWLYSRRAAMPSGKVHDPVFPGGETVHVDPELQRKLVAGGLQEAFARNLCRTVGQAAIKASISVARANLGTGKKGRVSVQQIEMVEGERRRVKLKLTCGGITVEVNEAHFNKLRELYRGPTEVPLDPVLAPFGGAVLVSAVFRVLARYSAFQGAHFKAGGFQAAIHGACFDVLLRDFGCAAECFASPMNCRYRRYCSAHPDTDSCFGSLGSFFAFHPTQGAYEANPPFDDGTIQAMAAHMDALLAAAAARGLPLGFVVIIPHLPDQTGWARVDRSAHKRGHVLLRQAEHGYFEGAQHDRINRYRVAVFDTSVFFLQTPAAAAKWPLTPAAADRLREAFRPKLRLNPHGLKKYEEEEEEEGEPPVAAGGDDNDEGYEAAAVSSAVGRGKEAVSGGTKRRAEAGGGGGGGGGGAGGGHVGKKARSAAGSAGGAKPGKMTAKAVIDLD